MPNVMPCTRQSRTVLIDSGEAVSFSSCGIIASFELGYVLHGRGRRGRWFEVSKGRAVHQLAAAVTVPIISDVWCCERGVVDNVLSAAAALPKTKCLN
jgi:hypothetical protein